VVIATRDRLRLLREAVESVRRQTAPNVECVVVDDGSVDGTWRWLEAVRGPDLEPVRLETSVERVVARNIGLQRSRGAFVVFLDDDDRLRSTALADLLAGADRRPAAVAVVGARANFGERGRRFRVPHPRQVLLYDVWREVLFGWVPVSGQVLFQTRALVQVGGWQARIPDAAEDQELWLRIGVLGPVLFVPATVLEYRVHGGQRRRPHGREVETQLREDHVAGLDPSRVPEARRVLAAREAFATAAQRYRHDEYAAAGGAMRLLVQGAPDLVSSPLTGPEIRRLRYRIALGRLLGVNAVRSGRWVMQRGRSLAGAPQSRDEAVRP
jgi:hypothetical protein